MIGSYDVLETDLLILGGGGAGLLAAIHAHDAAPGLDITIAVKALFGKGGSTRLVQGGYNAVLDPADSIEKHFQDTIKAGNFLNHQELVWTLVNRAPEMVRELERKHGCYFDRNPDGRIHQKALAGQSFDRTVHKGDMTGIEIMNRLVEQAFKREPRILEECRALDLLTNDNGSVCGAALLDIRAGRFVWVKSRATLLATGGGPNMYRIHSVAADKSCDGIAIAYRAGAELVDMEMVQFHPTGLLANGSRMNGTVLEEGLRGAGGRLLNGRGERFMNRYDPERLERSTRDIVARSSYLEIREGRGSPNGGVFIDVSHLGRSFVEKNFPGMLKRCLDMGFNLTRRPVEVSPTAHFIMGGVRVDEQTRSALEGLFVAGEDAGGVHGANRLGGNGVAEATVFGSIAGDTIPALLPSSSPVSESQFEAIVSDAVSPLLRSPSKERVFDLKYEMQTLMWDKAGLVRNRPGLLEATHQLDLLKDMLSRVSVAPFRQYNLEWQEFLNLKNLLTVSRLISVSALAREDSRGAHYREDHSEPDDERFLKNVFIKRGDRVELRPVNLGRLRRNA